VTLLWQYVNYFFPDVLNYMAVYYASGLIRFLVSSLIIVFPVFILVSWFLNKIYRNEAQVRESKIRKWLIYLTLFIASLVIIGDLVSVINMLLGGEITIRFILKALSVLVVAAAVFWYYIDDVRRDVPTGLAKPFAWVSGILVLAVVIGAFFIVGSPVTARLMQFDQQKVFDLQGIQSEIVNYWQRKEALPNSLADLNDPISGYKVPADPQNEEKGYDYEYNIKDAKNLSFELCANFNKQAKDQDINNRAMPLAGVPESYNQNWDHSSGRVCFERTIDKQLYPPLNKTTK